MKKISLFLACLLSCALNAMPTPDFELLSRMTEMKLVSLVRDRGPEAVTKFLDTVDTGMMSDETRLRWLAAKKRFLAGFPVLTAAISTGSFPMLFLLAKRLSGKSDSDEVKQVLADWRGPDGATLVHAAAALGQLDLMRMLNVAGLSVDQEDDAGNRPMHCAVLAGHGDAVRFLLKEFGAASDIAECFKMYRLALRMAAFKENPAIYDDIAKVFANRIPVDEEVYGTTTLHHAAVFGRYPVVASLVGAGADVDKKDRDGCRPIDLTFKVNAIVVDKQGKTRPEAQIRGEDLEDHEKVRGLLAGAMLSSKNKATRSRVSWWDMTYVPEASSDEDAQGLSSSSP